MKRLKEILLLIGIFLCGYFFIIKDYYLGCLIKKTIHLPCPACGLTRAFKSLIEFKIVEACKYNVLVIPVAILGILMISNSLYTIITNRKLFNIKLNNKTILIIVFLLFISLIVNICKTL